MRKTAIVMDSTGYLTPDILEKYQIKVVSLNVTIGDETFPETQLSNGELFAKLAQISGFSTTSQPSVGAFLEAYEDLFAQGAEEIVSIHISHALSGTLQSAEMARDLSSRAGDIYIFNSRSAGLSLGLMVWAAAEWAEQGLSASEIMERLSRIREQTQLYFLVDNLENLRRGGRIGGASALIGTLLQIKPILYINEEAKIDVFDKVRSYHRAWQRVLDQVSQTLVDGRQYRICVQHVHCQEDGERVVAELDSLFPGHDIRLFEAGAVIATHVGRGCIGVALQPWPV